MQKGKKKEKKVKILINKKETTQEKKTKGNIVVF